MPDMLTAEQRAAVEDRGRGLLVSAAAGSGKTRVLVERLFSYVEREGANLDEFLIITYTRAAAAELRGKIAAAISLRLRDDPTNVHLQRQLLRVYRADIKTVDAFCTALLRENSHLLGEDEAHRALRPDFRVLDEQDAAALRERVLRRRMERFYEGLEPGDGGTLLADTLGAGRDDRRLGELVSELYDKVQAQPYPEAWLREQKTVWRELPERLSETVYGSLLLRSAERKARHWAALLCHAAEEMEGEEKLCKSYRPGFLDAAASLRAFADATVQGWDAACACLPEFPRLKAVRGAEGDTLKNRLKRLWDSGKASVGKLTALFTVPDAEAMEDLRAMSGAMIALLNLTETFSRDYQVEKRRLNVADFSDQEHEAIRLLLDENNAPTELARTVSARYREIMVDEYQDTNEVQNRVFEAISREGKNLFTVGDVKQSIYRFRLADPTIFLDHYNTYPLAKDAEEGKRAKLILSRNFRSRREILEAANFVFMNILSVEMGELDYGADEALYPSASYPEGEGFRTEFHLLSLARQEGEDRLRAPEAEARFVAERIRALLDGGFSVTDEQTRLPRALREEDIVILMRSPSARLAEYRSALEARGIAVSAEAGTDIFASAEVSTVFSLLQIIDNPRQDVPLIAVLRSPLFGFTDDRLARLRGAKKDGDFYDALLADGEADARSFLDTLQELRGAAQTMEVHRLLAYIFDRCNVPGIFGAMRGGRERKENLLAFAEMAERFESSGFRSLFGFVSHVRTLRESAGVSVPAPSHGTLGVRIMSIHRSKGLEFPVVILADLAKAFNNMDFTGAVLVHPKYGLGPECVDTVRRIRYPTAARQSIERTLRREAKAEELRLLYVAMTRAKEKLILVHTQAGAAKRVSDLLATASCPALPESVDEGKCLGDWVMLPLLCRPEAQELRDLTGFDAPQLIYTDDTPWDVAVHTVSCCEEDAAAAKTVSASEPEETSDRGFPPDVQALCWTYPYVASTELSAKLTATQLKGRESDSEIAENAKLPPRLRAMERPRFLSGEVQPTGAERGTAIHLVMEHLDFFKTGGAESVRRQIDALLAAKILTKAQADAADESVIARFLQSDMAERIRRSTYVEREYRFSILRGAREYDPGAAEEDDVLLQGVVDCFFEENGALVVLDFKTDRINTSQTAQRVAHYTPQLEAYAAALARIMGMPVKEKALYFFATGECVTF